MTTATLPEATPASPAPAAAAAPAPAPVAKTEPTPAAPVATPAAAPKPAEAKPDAAPAAGAEKPKQLSLLDGDQPAAPPAQPQDAPPAEVTYQLKAPEKSPLTGDDLKAIEAFARERKLSPADAQALVERESATITKLQTAQQDKAKKDFDGLWDKFAAETNADPQIGGAKLKETVALANRALALPGAEGFSKMLKASPWANHAETLKFLAAVGRLTTEDHIASGAPASATVTKSPAQRWFPTLS